MIKLFLRVAFRNLRRQRIFSFINIMGLAVGMTACFLTFLYVHFKLNYDSFHSEANRILVATGMLTALIVLLTISFWIARATVSKRFNSLRRE